MAASDTLEMLMISELVSWVFLGFNMFLPSHYGDIFVDIWYTIWPFNIANWKITIYCRYIIYFYGSFSIAMLNNQRVIEKSWFFDDVYIILYYIILYYIILYYIILYYIII